MIKIECPNCGTQYLPGELFLPKHFLGQPTDIQRDENGKILSYSGIDQDLKEEYLCDKCNKKMLITANIKFNVTLEDDGEEHTTVIKKSKLSLPE